MKKDELIKTIFYVTQNTSLSKLYLLKRVVLSKGQHFRIFESWKWKQTSQ